MNYCERVLPEIPHPARRSAQSLLFDCCCPMNFSLEPSAHGMLAEVLNWIFNNFLEVLCKRASPSRFPVDIVDMLNTDKLDELRPLKEVKSSCWS